MGGGGGLAENRGLRGWILACGGDAERGGAVRMTGTSVGCLGGSEGLRVGWVWVDENEVGGRVVLVENVGVVRGG